MLSDHSYQTLNDILVYQKEYNPNAVAYRFIFNDTYSETISNAELYRRVYNLAAEIQKKTKPHDRIILAAQPGFDFIIGFYACLLTRTIAVPIFPPANAMMASRFLHVLHNAKPKLIICDKQIANTLRRAQKVNALMPSRVRQYFGISEILSKIFVTLKEAHIPILTVRNYRGTRFDEQQFPSSSSEDIAFLQYTSGSIGHPKGVMLSHANLLHNMKIIKEVVHHTEDSHVFSWLPPYHDMGLIAGIMEPLYAGIPATLMSTIDFIERPSRWMEGISKYRCTTTGAPNFAFELAALKTSDALLEQMNLSQVEVIANGAEPIAVESMNLFYEKFKVAGLRKGAVLPCYGLAESTVMVSGKPFLTKELIINVNPDQLKKNIIDTAIEPEKAKQLISSGIPQMEIKIVNPQTHEEAKPSEVGEVWIYGESVSSGYFNNTEETEKTFKNTVHLAPNAKKYLRTGDLGFMHQGELFVCGRLKNVIIIHGQNYYPHDIELAVASSDQNIRTGCVVAYSTTQSGVEALTIVAELRKETPQSAHQLILNTIQKAIAKQFKLAIHEVFLVPARAIPKTTSGKLQRLKCQELIENHSIKPLFHYVHDTHTHLDQSEQLLDKEDWLSHLENTSKEERRQFLSTRISRLLAEVLNVDIHTPIDLSKGFFDLGMDSLMEADFKSRLQEKLGDTPTINKAVTFGYSSVQTMINFLLKHQKTEHHAGQHTDRAINHSSTIELKNGRRAVLLIHGLSSSPLEMISCADALYQAGFSVRIPHYKTFGFDHKVPHKGVTAPWQEWKEEVLADFKQMKNEYEQIFVVGMCLGAILALDLAAHVGSEVDGLALLSTPFFYDGWATPWYQSLIPLIGKTPLKKFISYKEREPYGVKNEKLRTLIKSSMQKHKTSAAGSAKITLAGIYEAYLLTQKVKKNIAQINNSLLVIHAEEDETASLSNVEFIQNKIQSPNLHVVVLKDSYHMITLDNEKERVATEITKFFNTLSEKHIAQNG